MDNKIRHDVDIKRLIWRVVVRFGAAIIFVLLILFLTVGTLKYWNAWLFVGALFIPVIFILIYLVRNDPELL